MRAPQQTSTLDPLTKTHPTETGTKLTLRTAVNDMGCKTKKPKRENKRQHHSIGDMWKQELSAQTWPPTPTMAQKSLTTSPQRWRWSPHIRKYHSSPVTVTVMKDLLAELSLTIQANMAQLRKDLQGLTGRLGTPEADSQHQATNATPMANGPRA
ncbi:Hypothetical predicted protein [Pelobates cultripes]|uniref:Uncharacterized protein n=1 Tax=Pelobates cultripes TaxID=61616 RepID=A0AAD1SEW0_PELCU|nr:Hypothetical predicted protein [Pelobates cultripes]